MNKYIEKYILKQKFTRLTVHLVTAFFNLNIDRKMRRFKTYKSRKYFKSSGEICKPRS